MDANSSEVVLITGSSTGFGYLTAETLARRGYRVFATMRDVAGRNAGGRAALEQIASAENLPLEVLEMDVSNDASVESCVNETLARAGVIDVVINNAAMSGHGVTEAFTAAEFRTIFETNFFGVVRVNRAVLPSMRWRRKGFRLFWRWKSKPTGRPRLPKDIRQLIREMAADNATWGEER